MIDRYIFTLQNHIYIILIVVFYELSTIIAFTSFPDLEYRHGLDYEIILLHLPNSIIVNLFFIITFYFASSYLLFARTPVRYYYITIFLGFLSVINCPSSGLLWSWSQWGSAPLSDLKVAITLIFLVFYTTCLYYIRVVSYLYLAWLCIYTSYIVPSLRYHVFWFSDIHQRYSIDLLHIHINNVSIFVFYISVISFIVSHLIITIVL
jgi:hypothetical protein